MDSRNDLHAIIQWNDTGSEFPQVCTHVLFERQAAITPGAVAVAFGEQNVSYRDLNERANRLAHHLRDLGVGPDVLVGVCLERTPAMVVALVAIWKAGGAYVPLDPAYPGERLAFMIEDARPRVVLTDTAGRRLVASACDKTIDLESDWPAVARRSSENLTSAANPSDLAYVIYTSGSTGRPKGAMITHRGLVNYLWWAIEAYAVQPGCSVPVHSSLSFDLTVTSLYPALLTGGSIELLPEDQGAQNLLAALHRDANRGLVKITPAHLALLGHEISPSRAEGMPRAFVIGGENLLAETLSFWRDLKSPPRLFNEYGPTETVVGCCVYEVKSNDARTGPVPIGRPIANTRLYVLDADLRLLPPGEAGELYIGGAGVARGYLNRPDLTAERFLPDPFGSVPGDRLYKTGDLVRRRDDGVLEYLGRIDDQVKIHGYRIEPGEIEAALTARQEVRTCAVVAREDEPHSKQLVAYVVPCDGAAFDADGLRTALKHSLPDHMVPARIVSLAALPLTPNGKVDRTSLPPPPKDTSCGAGGQPRTVTEKAVAAIWSELLDLNGIGIHESFFKLGDSLSAIRLIEELDTVFGVPLNLSALFDQSTISGLAELIDALILTNANTNSEAGLEREEFEL